MLYISAIIVGVSSNVSVRLSTIIIIILLQLYMWVPMTVSLIKKHRLKIEKAWITEAISAARLSRSEYA